MKPIPDDHLVACRGSIITRLRTTEATFGSLNRSIRAVTASPAAVAVRIHCDRPLASDRYRNGL